MFGETSGSIAALLDPGFPALEAVVFLGVLFLLLGGGKLPRLMRNLHRGMDELKQGLHQLQQDVSAADETPSRKWAAASRVCGQHVLLIALIILGLIVFCRLLANPIR